jgi:hypothetical protein
MTDLPAATRALLLVATLDDGGASAEILAATGPILGDAELAEAALQPAIDAGLIAVAGMDVRFHHLLIRSAIYQSASAAQRRVAHAALADVLEHQLDRRAWHRATAALGVDGAAAAELEAAADRARRRGGVAVALAALQRAAQLSTTPAERGPRLLRAAELAVELGQPDVVLRLLRELVPMAHNPVDQGRLVWIREAGNPVPPVDGARIVALVEAADPIQAHGDTAVAMRLLQLAAARAWWASLDRQVRARIARPPSGRAPTQMPPGCSRSSPSPLRSSEVPRRLSAPIAIRPGASSTL